MEGEGGGGLLAAPFVAKTYNMVENPETDAVIAWGPNSNTFIVGDPIAFSTAILPLNFRHSNFSSFVRQLNTYGFRKVDPNRWEFAHESFLRGQTHLLHRIVRRSSPSGGKQKDASNSEEEKLMAAEVAKLKKEQTAMEDEMQRMWRRVREVEQRPEKILAFIVSVMKDPEFLQGITVVPEEEEVVLDGRKRARQAVEGGGEAGDEAKAPGIFGGVVWTLMHGSW